MFKSPISFSYSEISPYTRQVKRYECVFGFSLSLEFGFFENCLVFMKMCFIEYLGLWACPNGAKSFMTELIESNFVFIAKNYFFRSVEWRGLLSIHKNDTECNCGRINLFLSWSWPSTLSHIQIVKALYKEFD